MPKSFSCFFLVITTTKHYRNVSAALNVKDQISMLWTTVLESTLEESSVTRQIQSIMDALTDAWNNISLDISQRATQSW